MQRLDKAKTHKLIEMGAFGAFFEDLRDKKNLSMTAMARHMGISYDSYRRRVRSGGEFTEREILSAARALNFEVFIVPEGGHIKLK